MLPEVYSVHIEPFIRELLSTGNPAQVIKEQRYAKFTADILTKEKSVNPHNLESLREWLNKNPPEEWDFLKFYDLFPPTSAEWQHLWKASRGEIWYRYALPSKRSKRYAEYVKGNNYSEPRISKVNEQLPKLLRHWLGQVKVPVPSHHWPSIVTMCGDKIASVTINDFEIDEPLSIQDEVYMLKNLHIEFFPGSCSYLKSTILPFLQLPIEQRGLERYSKVANDRFLPSLAIYDPNEYSRLLFQLLLELEQESSKKLSCISTLTLLRHGLELFFKEQRAEQEKILLAFVGKLPLLCGRDIHEHGGELDNTLYYLFSKCKGELQSYAINWLRGPQDFFAPRDKVEFELDWSKLFRISRKKLHHVGNLVALPGWERPVAEILNRETMSWEHVWRESAALWDKLISNPYVESRVLVAACKELLSENLRAMFDHRRADLLELIKSVKVIKNDVALQLLALDIVFDVYKLERNHQTQAVLEKVIGKLNPEDKDAVRLQLLEKGLNPVIPLHLEKIVVLLRQA